MKLAIALLGLFAGMAAFAGSANGNLSIDGKTIELKHAYAMQIEDWSDKTKTAILMLVTDKPVPEKLLVKDIDTFDLRDAGVSGLKFEFISEGTNYAMLVVGAATQGSISISGTFDKEQFTQYSDSHVAGKLTGAKEFSDTKLAYEFEFETDVTVPVVETPPTAEDTAAAQKAESTKAYFAFTKALKAGDLKTLRASVSPERATQMDSPDFKEMLGFIQSMMPSDVKVLKATETGETAELILSGKDSGEDRAGFVTMVKKDGKWLIEKESWKSKN